VGRPSRVGWSSRTHASRCGNARRMPGHYGPGCKPDHVPLGPGPGAPCTGTSRGQHLAGAQDGRLLCR